MNLNLSRSSIPRCSRCDANHSAESPDASTLRNENRVTRSERSYRVPLKRKRSRTCSDRQSQGLRVSDLPGINGDESGSPEQSGKVETGLTPAFQLASQLPKKARRDY